MKGESPEAIALQKFAKRLPALPAEFECPDGAQGVFGFGTASSRSDFERRSAIRGHSRG
jgi:hypothetical protein